MRRAVPILGLLVLLAHPLAAQTAAPAPTADELVSKYVQALGGMDRINAVQSLRYTGRFVGGGGSEAQWVQLNRRPNLVREEFTQQGMTGITAYDGKQGWKIEPWEGKRDPEPLGEDEMKSILDDAVFDGPLVNYRQKGNKVEYVGMDPVEGSDTYKLKITLPSGDVQYYYLDAEYYVPIKVEVQRYIRGTKQEYEAIAGDYKQVNGWYLPFYWEQGRKGSSFRSKITFDTIEANVDLPLSLFSEPVITGSAPKQAPDASQTAPKAKDAGKSPTSDTPKPPAAKEH